MISRFGACEISKRMNIPHDFRKVLQISKGIFNRNIKCAYLLSILLGKELT